MGIFLLINVCLGGLVASRTERRNRAPAELGQPYADLDISDPASLSAWFYGCNAGDERNEVSSTMLAV